MQPLSLHEFHREFNARFASLDGMEMIADYGDVAAEGQALQDAVGILDFGFRSRICLTGADRVRFLHGQVTNDVKRLARPPGQGCYAALVTAKGKMQCDLNIYCLQDELLLDFEPGLTATVSQRLEKYIVSDDVQLVDVAPHYGLLTAQGPKATEVVAALELSPSLPAAEFHFASASDPTLGEIYLVNRPRLGTKGFDLFVPLNSLGAVADKLIAAAKAHGGRACGWTAFDVARIEAGIPRFGPDMDETNLPLECGIESLAISYSKGCYIGQEVINRIHTIGHVNRELRGLRLSGDAQGLPVKGDKLFHAGKEVGYITSATHSSRLNANIALGYVRREVNQVGTELTFRSTGTEGAAKVASAPFHSAI